MQTHPRLVHIFLKTVDLLDGWLRKMGTAPALRTCIVKFCKGRGYKRMRDVLGVTHMEGMARMAISQDEIGWRRFMEGRYPRGSSRYSKNFLQCVAPAGNFRNGQLG